MTIWYIRIARKVIARRIVESALIRGKEPLRIMLYICIGSVVEPGPATKKEITKSSMESVKARRDPERIPGKMTGIRTRQVMAHVPAPRSLAASRMFMSKSCSLESTAIVT